LEIYRYGPHHGEEPPVSGQRGSGTVFFSRCTLRCLYCQNYPWSQEGAGRRYDADGLAAALRELAAAGCHNWNLVSPTPWAPAIRAGLERAWALGKRLPVVYNTSGYETAATLRAVGEWVDIYLTDLRYASAAAAEEGSGAADYVETARRALQDMWRQTGPLETDAAGIARRGTICRVLILPGRAAEAVASLAWARQAIGAELPVSVMAQYTPAYKAAGAAPWNRAIDEREYAMVAEALETLGFEHGWIQEFGHPPPAGLLGCTMSPV
jgi:putative pyruvate formate lyase activating enzyme